MGGCSSGGASGLGVHCVSRLRCGECLSDFDIRQCPALTNSTQCQLFTH